MKKKINKPIAYKNKRATVLFADDEPIIREIIFKMLKFLGYDVMDCENGEDAIKIYKNDWKCIDLVILDIVMPHLDGPNAFLAMKEINPNIRALFISGYRIDKITQQIIDNYDVCFIQKPFSIPEFEQKINKSLYQIPV